MARTVAEIIIMPIKTIHSILDNLIIWSFVFNTPSRTRTYNLQISLPLWLSPPTTLQSFVVCSLDFIFTISFDLGGTRQVSTHLPKNGFCSVSPFYRVHRIWVLHFMCFHIKAPILEVCCSLQLSYGCVFI